MPLTIRLDKQTIQSHDLTPLEPYMKWNEQFRQFFMDNRGREHYRLLANVSSQLPTGSKVADLGTYNGGSALALSANSGVTVTTYDITECIPPFGETTLTRLNVTQKIMKCQDDVATLVENDVIMLDIAHDGVQEDAILELLAEHNYKGLLFMDDIHLNDPMRNTWKKITAYKKYDITPLGHWSGTGLVVFDPSKIDVEITM